MEENSVQEIKYSYSADVSQPCLQSDGIVLIPEPYADSGTIHQPFIESHLSSELKVIMHHLKYDDGYIEKSCTRFIYTLVDDKVHLTKDLHLTSQWMNEIKSEYDFLKNPNNKKAWQYLFDREKFHYESEKMFIASDRGMYLNTNIGWIKVHQDWFKTNLQRFPELANEYKMVKNIQSTT